MFGIDFAELLVIIAVIIIFTDPKDIPALARNFARFVKKVKSLSNEFNSILHTESLEPKQYIKDLKGKNQPTYDLSDLKDKQ